MGNRILGPLAAGVMLVAPQSAPEKERVVAGDGTLKGTVNGAAATLRIDPAAPAMPVLTQALAERAGLHAGMFGVAFLVGPLTIHAKTAVGRIDLGDDAIKRRVAWAERPYIAGVDAVVGPGGLPDPVVRFALHAPAPGERIISMSLQKDGGLAGGWTPAGAEVDVGGTPIQIRFSPRTPRTLATAGAGATLAAAFNARMEGAPGEAEIAFGVMRPVRDLVLQQPFALGPFSITRVAVRTADNGSVAAVPDADAPSPDPDEVVITGKGKGKRQRNQITVGADLLAACSSITFDKPAGQIRLSCR